MMRPRSRPSSLVLITALTSCRSEPTQPPPSIIEAAEPTAAPELAEPPPFAWQRDFELASDAGTFAVVSRGAGLWISPDASEPAAVFTSHEHRSDGAVLVLGRVGELVEVQLDWKPEAGLAYCRQPLFGLGLRVFVRETELADVIVEPQVIDFGDGTGFNLAPGVLVSAGANGLTLTTRGLGPRDHGEYALVPANTQLRIGKTFTPAHMLAGLRESGPEHGGRIRAGNEEYWDRPAGLVFARSSHDPEHVLVGGECLQIAGHYNADPEPLAIDDGGVRGGDGGTGEGTIGLPVGSIIGKGGPFGEIPNLWKIPSGAAMTWPDGSPAGTTVRPFVIQQKPTRKGSRRCFVPHFDDQWTPGLRFCVDATVAQFVG